MILNYNKSLNGSWRNKEEVHYFVLPRKKSFEKNVYVRLFWDKENVLWKALVEGFYKNGFKFCRGLFELDRTAYINLCRGFKITPDIVNYSFFRNILLKSSPRDLENLSKSGINNFKNDKSLI